MGDAGLQIKRLRMHLNYTQDEFANLIGSKRNSIAMIESGRNKPTFDLISEMCGAFNITADYFLTNDDPATFEGLENKKQDTENNNDIKNNVNLNVVDGVNLNSENGKKVWKYLDNSIEPSSIFYSEKMIGFDSYIYSELAEKFTPEFLHSRIIQLRESMMTYDKRINRELKKNNPELYDLMQLIGDFDALFNLIIDVISSYINDRPAPAEIGKISQTVKKTGQIPETVDYKDHKDEVIKWLQKLENYKDAIKKFYDQGEDFLQALKPLDTEGFIA